MGANDRRLNKWHAWARPCEEGREMHSGFLETMMGGQHSLCTPLTPVQCLRCSNLPGWPRTPFRGLGSGTAGGTSHVSSACEWRLSHLSVIDKQLCACVCSLVLKDILGL